MDSVNSRDIEVASSHSINGSLSASLGSFEAARDGNLRAIREENENTGNQRPSGASDGQECSNGCKNIANHAREQVRDSRQRKIDEWEERVRARLSGESGTVRFPVAPTGPAESWNVTSKRDKGENVALRLLQEHKYRMAIRRERMAREDKDRVTEEAELAELRAFALEASQWVEDGRAGATTPLPPYSGGHVLPEDIYEELCFKRLRDKMEREELPHLVKGRKENVYERLGGVAGDDPDGSSTEWSGPKEVYPGYEEDKARGDGVIETPKRRPPVRRRTVSSTSKRPTRRVVVDDSSSSEGGEKHSPWRLRGGDGSPGPSGTAANQDSEVPAVSPRLLPLAVSGDSEPMEMERDTNNKKRKASSELCALNDANPGMTQGDTLGLSQEVQRLGTKLSALIWQEKEKKKISIATWRDLSAIKEEYERLLGRAVNENIVMMGRLAESRSSAASAAADHKAELQRSVELFAPTTEGETDAYASNREVVKKKRRRKNRSAKPAGVVAAPNPAPVPAPRVRRPEAINREQEFILVERKKKQKKAAISEAESGAESRPKPKGTAVAVITARKEKLEKLKEVQPPKTFTMEVKEGQTIGEVKKALWSDVMKMTGAPKIASAKVLRSGKVQVIPADDQTYQALKVLSAERTNI